MEYPNTATLGTSTNPVGLINWKSMRMGQMKYARWSHIEPNADGIYTWTDLDAIISFQRQNGASVYFGLYGIPTLYSQTANNPTWGDRVTKGPWNELGECSYPNSLTALTNFVTAVINRYNKAGGAWYDANHAAYGKGIQSWETWNEPGSVNYTSGNTAGSSGAQVTSFWWGTLGQLVDFCYTQYAVIKAEDSTIKVTTPGFGSGFITPLSTFLAATGTINTTRTGAMTCDALAWHPYDLNPPGVVYGTWGKNIYDGSVGVQTLISWMMANGYNLPLWISECGVDGGTGTATEIAWYAAPAAFRYNWMARTMMVCAALGVQSFNPWNWSETGGASGNSGDWQADTTGVQKAYNDFAAKVSGKTIINGNYTLNGPVTLNFSDGSSWTV